jgi:hypothetical protein
MFRIPIRQALGVELNGQEEWKQAGCRRLQFHPFHHPVSADRGHLQWLGDPADGLMMCAVHAQFPPAGYLEQ